MKVSVKGMFYLSFGISIVARALTWTKLNIPYTGIIIGYIMIWGLAFFLTSKKDHDFYSNNHPKKFVAALALYYIIWGVYNIKDLNYNDTITELYRSLMMLAFITVSFLWISRFDDGIRYAIHTYFIFMSTFLIICFILDFKNINIVSTISSFWMKSQDDRTRTYFGFYAANIAAEYAMSTLLASFYVYKNNKSMHTDKTRRKIVYVDIILILMILANNSRGTTIALLLISGIYFMIKISHSSEIRKMVRLLMSGAVLALMLLCIFLSIKGLSFYDAMNYSNRALAIHNANGVIQTGHSWMGLGRISGAFFSETRTLYNYKFSYMEMYYIGVFVTSGIIGCIWMGLVIINIWKYIIKKKTNDIFLKKWIIICLIYSMIISFFEQYMFDYSYISFNFFFIIILTFIGLENRSRISNAQDYNNTRVNFKQK